MSGVASIADEFEAFAAWISTERPAAVSRIAGLQNGFEGWIKFEFFFWLTTVRRPPLAAGPEQFDVGLEYKVALDQRTRDMDRNTKQCDVWVRSIRSAWYHYVEIKAPFLNGNTGKVIDSVASDFWYMSRIRRKYELADSGNAIVLGVGFGDTEWRIALDRLRRVAGLPDEFEPVKGGTIGESARIRWCVFTRLYSSDGPD